MLETLWAALFGLFGMTVTPSIVWRPPQRQHTLRVIAGRNLSKDAVLLLLEWRKVSSRTRPMGWIQGTA
jgi:hypothetical protein